MFDPSQMTKMELLAVAVLRGDQRAALILADEVHENWVANVRQISPANRFTISAKNIRAVVYFPLRLEDGTECMIDAAGIELGVRRWLEGETKSLVLHNDLRLELYEIPTKEST